MYRPTPEILKELNTDEIIKVRVPETDEEFFLPLIETVSDYQWMFECLISRLNHPELYEDTEDVAATIENIKRWLAEHELPPKPRESGEKMTKKRSRSGRVSGVLYIPV